MWTISHLPKVGQVVNTAEGQGAVNHIGRQRDMTPILIVLSQEEGREGCQTHRQTESVAPHRYHNVRRRVRGGGVLMPYISVVV